MNECDGSLMHSPGLRKVASAPFGLERFVIIELFCDGFSMNRFQRPKQLLKLSFLSIGDDEVCDIEQDKLGRRKEWSMVHCQGLRAAILRRCTRVLLYRLPVVGKGGCDWLVCVYLAWKWKSSSAPEHQ